MSSILYKPGK